MSNEKRDHIRRILAVYLTMTLYLKPSISDMRNRYGLTREAVESPVVSVGCKDYYDLMEVQVGT